MKKREAGIEVKMSRNLLKDGVKSVRGLFKKAAESKGSEKFPTLEGHTVAQEQAEEAVETHVNRFKQGIQSVKKEFKIYRWSPDNPNQKPFLQSFHVDLSSCGPMVCTPKFIYLLIIDLW